MTWCLAEQVAALEERITTTRKTKREGETINK